MKKISLLLCLLVLYVYTGVQVIDHAPKYAKVVNAGDMKKLVKASAAN